MIVGGKHEGTPFDDVNPVNNFTFFPPKDARPSAFLGRSLLASLFAENAKSGKPSKRTAQAKARPELYFKLSA